MSQQQRRTDPRWTPQDLPEQPSYRTTAPGWGQVRHTPNRPSTDIAYGVIHTIEHSTLLRVVRSSRAITPLEPPPLPEPPQPTTLSREEWAEDAKQLAGIVDGAIRNLLPITGNPTVARIRGYLADLKARLVAQDAPGIAGAVQCITAALSAPATAAAHPRSHSAGDISSIEALTKAARRLLQRAGYESACGRSPRPTNPRIRQFRGE